MSIRKLVEEDRVWVENIFEEVGETLNSSLSDIYSGGILFGIEEDAFIRIYTGKDFNRICELAVRRSKHHQGLGETLVKYVISEFKGVWVVAAYKDYFPANSLYNKLGFSKFAEWSDIYGKRLNLYEITTV